MHDAPIKLRRLKVDPEMLSTALLYVLAVICVIALMLLVIYLIRYKRMKSVADQVDRLGERFYPLLERVKTVEEHAVDYANSLDAEALVCLEELQKMARSIESFLFEVESRLGSGEFQAIREADLFLQNRHPAQHVETANYDGVKLDLRIDPDWERHMERLLQIVGKSVSNASLSATHIGVPKRKKRRPTLLSLFRAGIKMDRGPYQS